MNIRNNKKMIVAMACNKNWYHYLMVDIYSLLECTKSIKKIYLLVETNKISDITNLTDIIIKYKIEVVVLDLNVYLKKYLSESCPNIGTIYTSFSFGRLLLPEIVKEDRVLYIDTDAIVRRDISNLWNYDIRNYYNAGVRDYGIFEDHVIERYGITGKYINSGVVLFNLKKIREDNVMEKWFELINNKELLFPDQDALNIVCQNNEIYLPAMYNSCEYGGVRITMATLNESLIKIYHYAGLKEFWVADRLHCEEWYDAEEKFYNEFGWPKNKEVNYD